MAKKKAAPKKKKAGAEQKAKKKIKLMTKSQARKFSKELNKLFDDIAEATAEGKAIYSFHAKKKHFDSLHAEGLIKRGGKNKKGWVLSAKGERSLEEED